MPGIGNALYINKSHPLLRGAVSWWLALPHLAGGAHLKDVLAGVHGVRAGTSVLPKWGSYASAPVLDFTDAGGVSLRCYLDCGSSLVTADIGLAAFSLLCKVRITHGFQNGIAERNDGNSVNAGWLVGVKATAKPLLTIERSSSNYGVDSDSTLSANAATHLAVTFDGNIDSATSGIWYINGQSTTGVVTVGSGARGSDASRKLLLGNNAFGSCVGSLAGELEYLGLWRRQLSAAEVRQWYDLSRSGYPGLLVRRSMAFKSTTAATGYLLVAN